MTDIIKTMKLHIRPDDRAIELFKELTIHYSEACNYISEYVFDNGFMLNNLKLQDHLYHTIRKDYSLKAQMTISAIKTVTARYKAIKKQMKKKPFVYKDENGKKVKIPRTLEWLHKPVYFKRPQVDLVRNRDYSFVNDKVTGKRMLSLNTIDKRVIVSFDVPEYFKKYFDGTWKFGTGKLVSLNGGWYFHIPMTKTITEDFDRTDPEHVVGIDQGLRFIATVYDEAGSTNFINSKEIMKKRESFQKVRSELQSKGTKTAKRALKRISGRENRWMTDINHQLSKTLVEKYGKGTLFVVEDLTGVSFDEKNLSNRSDEERKQLRSWSFYQLEQFIEYKAQANGSKMIKVEPAYTSQRCPVCGRIYKENHKHRTHEYICDKCGYRSNDDRVGAMNIQQMGLMYIAGTDKPKFKKTEEESEETLYFHWA